MQSKSLLCVVYDELVLTHEYARERVGNTCHRGNTYPREGEQISLLVHQGEHISPRAWLEISVRGNRKSGGTHISVTPALIINFVVRAILLSGIWLFLSTK